VPPGSYLALSHVASDIEPDKQAEAAKRYNRLAHDKQHHRSHAEVTRFFAGLDMAEPGIVPVQQWRPDSDAEARSPSAMWGGVGRKP
jgi:S-adenosyl methyltransferase